jgi:ubiquinone/menaquinone biosynthesis C-methylase UbiE
MQRDEWDPFFDEMYLKTYGARERGGEAEEQALAAVQLAGCEAGANVLDAPCGYGRHSIPLARADYRIVGADRSEGLLAEARRRAGEGGWQKWVRADHRDLPFEDGSFDAVLNLFSSLGYRGEAGDRQTLAQFLRVLRPGGSLVVETMHRDRLMTIFQPRGWDPLPDGGIVVEDRSFDHVAGENETTHMLVDAEGRRESFTYRMRLYTATELARLLEEVGFAQVECFGGFDREPLSHETRLAVLARKAS